LLLFNLSVNMQHRQVLDVLTFNKKQSILDSCRGNINGHLFYCIYPVVIICFSVCVLHVGDNAYFSFVKVVLAMMTIFLLVQGQGR